MTELKNSIESFNIRLNHTEERIKDLENGAFEVIQMSKKKKKGGKKKKHLHDRRRKLTGLTT